MDGNDPWLWFVVFGVIYLSFYFFTSPFVGNPELLTTWTPYVYLSMGLYGWLLAAAALHIPLHQLGFMGSTIKQPISLIFPFFSVTFIILILLELLTVLIIPKATSCLGITWKTGNVTLLRSFANVVRNSAAVSVACVVLIIHCDASVETDGEVTTYNQHACEQLFLFSSPTTQFVPTSYRGAMVIWLVGISLAVTNFVLERISGIQVISFNVISQRRGGGPSEFEDHLHEKPPAEHRLPMVPWYSMFLFDTAFQLLISFKVFLGRFDHRSLQRALYPKDESYLFDHLAERDDLWLDFMADCGDGFNSSYHVARLLAQPELEVDCPEELLEQPPYHDVVVRSPSAKRLNRKSKQRLMKKRFPRGDSLVIGGDLAYPHPDSESYESRLWRCFEYAMKPPTCYNPNAISTGDVTLPKGFSSLREYDGPTAFAIPGNHDWFDGLNTFTRFIAHRDWLGGWLLPQKTSHFCLKLPHNWWLLGIDLALENDINTEQFALFERLATKHMSEKDSVIIVTHEPRWVLDNYEQHEKSEEKLGYLMNHVLKGKVVLRLAGDIHNYTRHSLKNLKAMEKPCTNTMEAPSPKHTQSPSKLRTGGHSTSNRVMSPTKKHFPHMFMHENESISHSRNRTKPSIVGETPGAHHLIIAGGGGAFLHPTHAPKLRTLDFNGHVYKQRSCYPPSHVSRRYALLNVFGFRRINWRFDMVGGLGYFLLVFSMFPRCSIRSIYLSSTWQEAAIHFVTELQQIQYELWTVSYVSFVTYIGMIVALVAFADCTSMWQKWVTGLVVSLFHSIAASSILLIFECLFEIASERGSLGHEGESSLYRYFSLSTFDLSALQAVDFLHLTHMFSEFMKFGMTMFDVPEMVAIGRMKICSSPAGIDQLTRVEQWQYYLSLVPYFWVLATPVVGVVFGGYLYVALNVFGRHYNEAFSALRISSYKNFLRMHFHSNGDLELFAFGIDKVPRHWCRDPNWSGGTHVDENKLPSYKWTRPSHWQPVVSKVGNIFRMDFENPELDTHFNMNDRSNVHLIDRVLIRKSLINQEQK